MQLKYVIFQEFILNLALLNNFMREKERRERDGQAKGSLVWVPALVLSLWECSSRSSKVLKSQSSPEFLLGIFLHLLNLWCCQHVYSQNLQQMGVLDRTRPSVTTSLPAPTTSSAFSQLSWWWSYFATDWDNSRYTTDKVFFDGLLQGSSEYHAFRLDRYLDDHYMLFWGGKSCYGLKTS